MKTCETCKHWTNTRENLDLRFSNVVVVSGDCDLITDKAGMGDGVRVYSDSVPICTESGFGCIHHEEK
jgi:hypothetical protein